MSDSVVERAFRGVPPAPVQAEAILIRALTPTQVYVATRRSESTGMRVYVKFVAITGRTPAAETTNRVRITSILEEDEVRYRLVLHPRCTGAARVQFKGRRFLINDQLAFRAAIEFDLFERVG